MAACVAQIMARSPLGLIHRVDGAAARPRQSASLAHVAPTSRALNPRVRSRAARCASFECPGSQDELAERRMALAEFAKQQQQQQQNSFALSLLLPPSRSSPCLCCVRRSVARVESSCAESSEGRASRRESSRAVSSKARIERRGESRASRRGEGRSSVEAPVATGRLCPKRVNPKISGGPTAPSQAAQALILHGQA